MKKTNSMRVAVAMLALTLITSCFVGGTFAKYTTSASGVDGARVTKFGVEIDAGESAFLKEYEADDDAYTAGYTVASSDKVVAPGTSGEIDLFKISGEPEVAVRVNVEMSDIESIYLKGKNIIKFTVNVKEWEEEHYTTQMVDGKWVTIPDPIPTDQEELETMYNNIQNDTWGNKDLITKEEVPEVYYPITWTLIKDGNTEAPVATGKLEDIKAYLDTINGKEFAPGTDLATEIGGSYKLTWSWAFESDNDEKDTALGNFAVGITDPDYVEYSIDESFNFSITVTQID